MTNKKGPLSESAWRVFCAIEIPIEVREQIVRHAERLRLALPEVQATWARPENIHLTLKFFGNLTPDQVENASEAASRAVTDFSPFKLGIEGAGSFPARGPARVLWIGIRDESGNLERLQSQLEKESETSGLECEDRPFHPHLTVSRLRGPSGARALADKHSKLHFEAAEIEVPGITLFRSELSSKGSSYTVISKHPLRKE